jgi:hypothetical protein
MKKAFKLFKFVFLVAFVFGGWALAAASLHVVRAPGSMLWDKVPLNVQFIPKNTLTFKDTFIDTTKWSVADVDAHPDFVKRLDQANKSYLIDKAKQTPDASQAQASAATPSLSSSATLQKHTVDPTRTPQPSAQPAPAPAPSTATPAKEEPKPKSIFDFPAK